MMFSWEKRVKRMQSPENFILMYIYTTMSHHVPISVNSSFQQHRSQLFNFPKRAQPQMFKQAVHSLMSQNFKFAKSMKNLAQTSFMETLPTKLLECCRKNGHCTQLDTNAVTSNSKPLNRRDVTGPGKMLSKFS